LDPLVDGFGGVLLEIHRRGDEYVLLEMAPTTGECLLRFSSKDRELGASLRQTLVGLHPHPPTPSVGPGEAPGGYAVLRDPWSRSLLWRGRLL
jgi:hypothetical protein